MLIEFRYKICIIIQTYLLKNPECCCVSRSFHCCRAGNLTKTCLSSVLSFYVIWFISANQSSVKMQGSFICSELKYSLSKFQKLSKWLVARKANFLFLSLAFSLFLSLAFSLPLSAIYNLLLDITGA